MRYTLSLNQRVTWTRPVYPYPVLAPATRSRDWTTPRQIQKDDPASAYRTGNPILSVYRDLVAPHPTSPKENRVTPIHQRPGSAPEAAAERPRTSLLDHHRPDPVRKRIRSRCTPTPISENPAAACSLLGHQKIKSFSRLHLSQLSRCKPQISTAAQTLPSLG